LSRLKTWSTASELAPAQKIEVGMTQEQIRDILGGPPRNESACPLEPVQYSSKFRLDEWRGPDIVISVWFDAQGRKCHKRFLDHAWGAAKKPWEEICSWLPLSRSAAPN
jgi:hypothetical protein